MADVRCDEFGARQVMQFSDRRCPPTVIGLLWRRSVEVDRPTITIMDCLGHDEAVGGARRSIGHKCHDIPVVLGSAGSLTPQSSLTPPIDQAHGAHEAQHAQSTYEEWNGLGHPPDNQTCGHKHEAEPHFPRCDRHLRTLRGRWQ